VKIISKDILAQNEAGRIVKMRLEAPAIASNARAGQFVILMVSENGERIPLTIAETKDNTVMIIFQEAGYSTKKLGEMAVGDELFALVGPLGHPVPVENYGKVIAVAGGVGIAEVYPVIKALKNAGNIVVGILGARNKDFLILHDEIKAYCDRLYVTTDDGSFGEKGFVSDVLLRVLKEDANYQLVYCVGPIPMMKVVAAITRHHNIKTIVCLNSIMLDGTGMCGSCRLTEDGKVKFCCVDGPDFDGHKVDFEELSQRHKRFLSEEKISIDKIEKKCKCINE
jgi:ferredoxin--NADP+ reductase